VGAKTCRKKTTCKTMAGWENIETALKSLELEGVNWVHLLRIGTIGRS